MSAFFSLRRQPWSSFTALCLSVWFVCLWHCRMAFETPYRVRAVLKMTSMNILVWKAYHPRSLSPHGKVMEVLKQKIHLCIPALQRLLRNIPPFISPPGQVVWELLEAKEGCPQDGKYSLYWFSLQANSHALRQEQCPCAMLWEMSQWAKHAGVRRGMRNEASPARFACCRFCSCCQWWEPAGGILLVRIRVRLTRTFTCIWPNRSRKIRL